MLYWLLYQKLFPYFRVFRIFRYLTFRTVFASLTALLIGMLIGPYVIERLREFQIGQYVRDDGPQTHLKKGGTPTMGGVLICISILVPTLLWADLSNPYVWVVVLSTLAFGGIGFAVLISRARDMNLLSLGDDEAAELGVEVDAVRRTIFIATSVMIGAAVSVSGIISFVGLIVPHIIRTAIGADHRMLIPASILGGAAFTVAADLIARTVIAPSELPVGAITALCGGPFFIYVLRREGRKSLAL